MSEVAVPRRQRRRPALSCAECRRRKIKCDRKKPCSHCLQYKNAVCTYPDSHSPLASRRTGPEAAPNSLLVNEHQQIPQVVTELTPGVSGPPFLATSLSPQSLSSLVDSSQSDKDLYTSGSPSEKITQNLVNRTRSQEKLPISSASFSRDDEVMSVFGVDFSSHGDVMLMVGLNHHRCGPKVSQQSCAPKQTKSSLDATHFFGRSHYMNTFNMFSLVCRYKTKDGNFVTGVESREVREIDEKCTRLEKLTRPEPIDWHSNPNFKDYMPQRDLADELVGLYLRTCESIYRILHIPSFQQEYADYWNDPPSVLTPSVIKILLVMAIGTCFYQGEAEDEVRSKAQQWIRAAESWTSAPLGKKQLTVSTIQIHCILLLARQTNSIGVDLIWISSGNLLRTAFSLGLHRDPKHFQKLSLFAGELRRRIWATVLEMAIQTSIQVGMPPLISSCDFDTEPPSNINDEEISESTAVMPNPKPNHVYTQTSIQITLLKSLRTRLEIVHFINSFHSEPSYDDVLRFGQNITKACNDANRLIHSYPTHLPRPTAFQSNLLDIFLRRFLLEVHRPFFKRSQTDPRYYYFRKVCLDAALVILFHSGAKDLPPDHDPQIIPDYERFRMIDGSLFRPVFFPALMIVTVELVHQLEEDIASGLPPSIQTKASRQPLYQAVDDMSKLTMERFRMGEYSAKGPMFLSAAAANIHAMTNGIPPEQIVPEAAKRSARECLEILTAKINSGVLNSGLEERVDGDGSGGEGMGEQQDFEFDFSMGDAGMEFGMQDGGLGFDLQDSWLFTAWDAN